jgi:glycosyltransferase involved in cell wall biosynthesis
LAGARPETCRLVGWGVDTAEFKPNAEARQRVRQELGVTDDEVVVLSTRQLSPLYRVSSVIEAFAAALARRDDLVLVVLDDGPDRAKLEKLAHKLGVTDRVRFTGYIETMPDALAAGDLVVSVPASDGAPMSLIEAMAVGLPVVGSDLPPYREWLKPGVTGVLWSGDEVTDLADAILAAIIDSPGRGDAARARICAQAEQSEQLDRVIALYSALVAGEPLPPDPVGHE